MLYYNFDGYEGFNCRFGIIEHDNGKKTRRNRILLDFIKDKQDTARLHKGQEPTKESDNNRQFLASQHHQHGRPQENNVREDYGFRRG